MDPVLVTFSEFKLYLSTLWQHFYFLSTGGYGSFSLHQNLQESRPNDTISRVSLNVISSSGIHGQNLETNILHTTSGGGIIVRRQHQPLMSATFPSPHTIPLTYTTSKPSTTHPAIANPFTIPELPILHQFHNVDAILKAVSPVKNIASSIALQHHQGERFQGDFTVNRKWTNNSNNGVNTDPRNPNLGTGSVLSNNQQWIEMLNGTTNVKLQHSSNTEGFPTRYHQQPVRGDVGNKERTVNSKIPLKGTNIPSVITSIESSLSRIHVNKSTRVQPETLNPLSDAVANTPFSIVTLIPVRSNSGVGKPLRPRPKLPSHVMVQIKNNTEPMDVVSISEHALKDKADHRLSSSISKPMESHVVYGVNEGDIPLKQEGNLAGLNKKSEESMISFNQSSTEALRHKAGSIALDRKPQSSDKYPTELPLHSGIISSLSQQTSMSPLSLTPSSKIPTTVNIILMSLNVTQMQSPTTTVPLLSATRPILTSSIHQSMPERLTQSMQQLTSGKLTSSIQQPTSEKFSTMSPKQGTSLATSSTVSPVTISSSKQQLTSQKLTTVPQKQGTSLATSSTVSPVTISSSKQQLTSQKLTTVPPKKETSSAISSTLSPANKSSSTQQLTSLKLTTVPPKKGTSSATSSTVSPTTSSTAIQKLTPQKLTTVPQKKGTSSTISSTLSPVTTSSSSSSSILQLTSVRATTLLPKQGKPLETSSTVSPITTSSPILQLVSQKLTTLPTKKGTSSVTSSILSSVSTSSSTQLISQKQTTVLPTKGTSSAASTSTLSPVTTATLPWRKITQTSTVPKTKVTKTPTQSSAAAAAAAAAAATVPAASSSSISSSRIKSTQATTRTTLPPSILSSKTTVNVHDSISYINHESQNNKTVTDQIKNITHTVERTTILPISNLQQIPVTEVWENTTADSNNNTNIKETNRKNTSQIPAPNQPTLTTESPSHSTQTSTVPILKDSHSTLPLSSQSTIIHTPLINLIPVFVIQDSADEISHTNNLHKQIAKVDSLVPTLEISSNTSNVDDWIGGQKKDITNNTNSVIKNIPKIKNNAAPRTPQPRDKNATENGEHQNISITISKLQSGNKSTDKKAESAAENIRNTISPPNVVKPFSVILNTDTVTTTSIEISFGENEGKVIVNPVKSSNNITSQQVHNDQSSTVDLPITVPSAVMEMTPIHKVKETRRQPKMKLTNTYALSTDKLRLEQRMMDSNGNIKTEERADTKLLMPKVDAIIDTTTTNINSGEDDEKKNITLMSAEYEPGNYNYSITLNIPTTIFIKLNSTTESSVPENYTSDQVSSAVDKTIIANVNIQSNVRTHLTKDGSPQTEEFPVNFSFTVAEDPLAERTNEKIIQTTEEISSTLYDVPMPHEDIFSTEDEVASTSNDTLEIFTNFTVTKVTGSSNLQSKPPPESFEMSDDDIIRLLNATRNHSIMSQEVVNTLSKYANIHTAISSNNMTHDTRIKVNDDDDDDDDKIRHETTENYIGEKITNVMATEEAKLSTIATLPYGSNSHAGIPILTKIYNKAPQLFGEKLSSTEAANPVNTTGM